ncbi:MAG: hypothetical protein IT433_12865 [Phycisphaerales bacterium]|nr:hypothetical protein [Phycisphaerales bacterium]
MRALPLALLCLAAPSASAQHFDLRTDFDLNTNPGEWWSYRWGGAPLRVQLPGLNEWIGPGWGFFASYDASFSVALADNPVAFDMRQGDILAHSWSGYLGGSSIFFTSARWTCPRPGTATISGRAWHADMAPGREGRWTLVLDSTELARRDTIFGTRRSDAAALFSNNISSPMGLGPIPLTTGQIIEFRPFPVPETGLGHFVGVDLTIEFCPFVATEPPTQSACPRAAAGFSLSPLGAGPHTFLWQVSADNALWFNVADGPNSSPHPSGGTFSAFGSDSSTLTTSAWSGTAATHFFRCVATSAACGNTLSTPASLSFLSAGHPACPPCDPDLNQDGNADQDDVLYLINVVGGGDNPSNIDPDFNQDGNVDQDDVSAVIAVVAGGACP